MFRVFDVPWLVGENAIGMAFDIPVQYSMGRGFTLPWVGVQNTMNRRFDIP
jgi:hypothetical protein